MMVPGSLRNIEALLLLRPLPLLLLQLTVAAKSYFAVGLGAGVWGVWGLGSGFESGFGSGSGVWGLSLGLGSGFGV